MIINLIRHGKTKGNLEKRYIGRTDEALADEGVGELKKSEYPECDVLYASPMLRCIQTAEIIYPQKNIIKIEDFRECDFGIFEGHNYSELSGNPLYQQWIDSYGKMDFPEGEAVAHFKERTIQAFDRMIEQAGGRTVSLIAHGGTIMAILEKFEETHDYYKWQAVNGCGYVCEFCDGKITILKTIEK